jgi:hypothetical protein
LKAPFLPLEHGNRVPLADQESRLSLRNMA